jgi:hypothetical protein
MITKVVSGGQTGVDHAALDFAIEWGIRHAGFAVSTLRGAQVRERQNPAASNRIADAASGFKSTFLPESFPRRYHH